MADLVTNIYLRTQHFDQSIQSVQKQLDALNKKLLDVDKKIATPKKSLTDFSSVLSSAAVKSLTKFAGGLGLAMTAGEAFEKAMRSCQTTSDMFDNSLNAAKGTVDSFFRSLVSGDWSAFNDGLLGAFRNLKEVSAAMDELADKKLSLSYIKADDMADLQKYKQIARDTTRPEAERKNAAQMMQSIFNHMNKKIKETYDFDMQQLIGQYKAETGFDFNFGDFDHFFKHTNFSGKASAEASAAYKESMRLQNDVESKYAKYNQYVKQYGYDDKGRRLQQEYDNAKQTSEIYSQQNQFLIKQGVLVEENDEKRKNTLARLKEQLQAYREMYSMQIEIDEVYRSVFGGNTKTQTSTSTSKSVKVDTPAPVGSIAEIEKKIASLKKEFQDATTDGLRYRIQIELEKAERELKMMRLRAQKMDRLPSGMSGGKAKNPLEGMDTSDLNPFRQIESPIKKDEATLDYLTTIGSLLGNISGATDNATAAWMNYFSSILQGTVALLPLLASVFKIKAMEAIAEQAGLKFPLNIIAMAATAAGLVASIANIPKFATGGIVSGSSFVGDNVIARVNSGEMILNTRQQANLFSMLDGGARTNVQGTNVVKWHIEGRDLVGVLANQINKTSKYK